MQIFSIFISLLLILTSCSCNKERHKDFRAYPLKDVVEVNKGGSGFITLKIEIPQDSYIYGNPKGPGIGMPTTITAFGPNELIIEPARYLPPKKYIAPGEKEFVWIYENGTKIFVPLSAKDDSPSGVYKTTVSFKSLLCRANSCTPLDFNIEYSIKILGQGDKLSSVDSGLLSEFMTSSPTEKYSSTNKMSSRQGDNKGATSNEEEIFKPIYLSYINVTNILQAILYGLIAGFFLNFMPCVLPVVSLKVMSFIKYAGEDRSKLIKLGILFTLGILTTFFILAFLSSFFGYNWGELFKKRLFLITMIAVVFALTLSMFDVFTINLPSFIGRASKDVSNQYADAYMKGLLATLLATPCSGPFLGGTLAWALTQKPIIVFIIFMSIGLGMALPYIILTINPRFMSIIPKPGDWMIVFERIMAFLLMATVIYLIGILEQEVVMPTLWLLLFIGVALWQYGRFGAIFQTKNKRIFSTIALCIIIISGYLFPFQFLRNEKEKPIITDTNAFSIERLYENRKNGRISIIKFTADWCPNCKLVERVSLYTPDVFEAMDNNNVDLLVADMTRENPIAEDLLYRLGSSSLPFLAVFPVGESFTKPICLRDIYSDDDVVQAISMAK
ncbi:MAG: cytochrome c biogenesis protein CcdA [Spirochaetota bacterium]|nr:cytochrome c biogenesis protein CcdA [Spirochaetota bacterium]